jgi:hypothetical protein
VARHLEKGFQLFKIHAIRNRLASAQAATAYKASSAVLVCLRLGAKDCSRQRQYPFTPRGVCCGLDLFARIAGASTTRCQRGCSIRTAGRLETRFQMNQVQSETGCPTSRLFCAKWASVEEGRPDKPFPSKAAGRIPSSLAMSHNACSGHEKRPGRSRALQ